MQLKTYYQEKSLKNRLKFRQLACKKLKINKSTFYHWLNKTNFPTPQHCIDIECLTDFSVSKEELRPDIFGLIPTIER